MLENASHAGSTTPNSLNQVQLKHWNRWLGHGLPAGENFKCLTVLVKYGLQVSPALLLSPLNTFLSSLLLYVDKRILESCEPHLYQFGPRALMWGAGANP